MANGRLFETIVDGVHKIFILFLSTYIHLEKRMEIEIYICLFI
jgi:hypothetical protein